MGCVSAPTCRLIELERGSAMCCWGMWCGRFHRGIYYAVPVLHIAFHVTAETSANNTSSRRLNKTSMWQVIVLFACVAQLQPNKNFVAASLGQPSRLLLQYLRFLFKTIRLWPALSKSMQMPLLCSNPWCRNWQS